MMNLPMAAASPAVVSPPDKPTRWGVGLKAGQTLLHAGHAGPVWRVSEGLLRVEKKDGGASVLIQLAGPGDWVGLQALDAEPYACTVTALTPCRAHPVNLPHDAARTQTLAAALHQQQRQALDMARLRTGPARARMQHLLALLAQATGCELGALARRSLPPLKDMAQIVDTAPETVCRELAHWLPKSEPRPARARRVTATSAVATV